MKILHLLLLIVFLSGCSEKKIIEKNYVADFKVDTSEFKSKKIIGVSGHSMDSALCVDELVKRVKFDKMILEITLKLTDKKCTGYFHYKIPVTDNINALYFGREKSLIWKRSK